MLISPKGWDILYALHFGFSFTNNETEYEALIVGLAIAKEMEIQHLKVHNDSRLIVSHILNEYKAQAEYEAISSKGQEPNFSLL